MAVMGFTEEGLAQRSGASPERIRRLVQLGILTPAPGDEAPFRPVDIQRVRVAQTFEDSGFELESLGKAIGSGAISFSLLDLLFPNPASLSDVTYRALADQMGLPLELIDRLHIGFGLPRPDPDDLIRDDDAELLPLLPTIMGVGLSEAELIRGVRMYGENLRRVAESQVQLLHTYMERSFDVEEGDEVAIFEQAARVSHQVRPIADRLVMWLYRRHREHYATRHLVEHAERVMELTGVSPSRPANPPAISFLDLTGFTQLTEEQGDEVAADLASSLAELVLETSARHAGRAVKWLGDGVMFHFPDPDRAVLCGLELVQGAQEAGLPPARIGVHAGAVIFREGDYFGRTVNVAARIADYARPAEVLVSEDIVATSRESMINYRRIGPILLKGLPTPVDLYTAVVSEEDVALEDARTESR
jgi:adenylate cyclase